jgi:hypothetical protein
MKTLLFCLSMLGLAGWVSAQDQALFDNVDVVGGFGGPIFEFGQVVNETGGAAGGGGGVVINNFFLGGFGMGVADFSDVEVDGKPYEVGMGFGGIWMGYTPFSSKVIHPYTSLRLGWGGASLYPQDSEPDNYPETGIFVVTPELGLEVNIFQWFRIGLTGGYRMVNGANELPGISDSDLSSFTGGLTLRFGWFNNGYDSNHLEIGKLE